MTKEQQHHGTRSTAPRASRGCTLGGVFFASKERAREHVQEILAAHTSPFGKITDPHALAVLHDLLRLNPKRAAWEAIGVAGFDTWIVIPYGTPGFRVVLADGTRDPFSFRKSLGLKSDRERWTHAFRSAIAPQTQAWKTSRWNDQPVTCATSGVALTWDVFHVDHAPPWPFRKILAAYLGDRPIDSVAIRDAAGSVDWVLADPAEERAWAEFHRERAVYRALHVRENLRLAASDE